MIKKIILSIIILFIAILTLKADIYWNDYYWKKATILPNNFPSTYWLEFHFLPDNPKYGYAVGTVGTNPNYGGRGAFAKTSDSGKTWHASYITTHDFHAESVIFIDTNTGYCSGTRPGALYKTTNGGDNWNLVSIFSGSWGCYAIGNSVWIADGSCNTDYGQIIYSSTDGGDNWNAYKIPNNDNHITDFKMVNESNGYVIGSGAIFITNNGGKSWSKLCNTPPVQWTGGKTTNINWHEDINIYNRSILIPAAGGCGGNTYSDNQGAILFSTDRGTTWNTPFKTKGCMFGTYLTNDSSGWACGYYKEVYYTRNYGKSWNLMNCGITNNAHMDDLWFINDTTGFVCGQGDIYMLVKKDYSKFSISGDSLICKNDYAILKAGRDFEKYEWYQITSQGDTIYLNKKGQEVVIENTGKYIVKGINVDDCYYVYSAPFSISKGVSKPDITLTTFCLGDTIIIDFRSANDNEIKHLWEPESPNGDKMTTFYYDVDNILVYKTIYNNYTNIPERVGFVYGYDIEGKDCIDTFWLDITFKERVKPILKADGSTTFCDNIDRNLYIENATLFSNNTWYLDNNKIAENINSYKPIQSGTYKVITSNNGNCIDSSDAITVIITDDKDALLIEVSDICFIDSVNYGKQSYKKFILYNISDKEFVLNSVTFRYKIAFTTPLSQFPIIIPANGSEELIVFYSPTNLDWQYDTIYIEDYCSTHPIPLQGFGLGNIDSTNGPCDINIIISTRSIIQKEIIQLGLPIPNPSNNKGKISYKIIFETDSDLNITKTSAANNDLQSSDNISEKIKLQLYDMIGNPIDIDYSIDKKEIEIIDEKEIHNGEINFDIRKLYSGVYFIRISYETASKVFSIIKK